MGHRITHCHIDRPREFVNLVWVCPDCILRHELCRDCGMESLWERVTKNLQRQLSFGRCEQSMGTLEGAVGCDERLEEICGCCDG